METDFNSETDTDRPVVAKQRPNRIKVTGLWKSTTQNGEEFLSGQMSKSMKLVIYKNKKKTDTDDIKLPDYIAYYQAIDFDPNKKPTS